MDLQWCLLGDDSLSTWGSLLLQGISLTYQQFAGGRRKRSRGARWAWIRTRAAASPIAQMPRKWCLNGRALVATLLARIRVLADGGCPAPDLRSTSRVRRTRRACSRPPVAVPPAPSGILPT